MIIRQPRSLLFRSSKQTKAHYEVPAFIPEKLAETPRPNHIADGCGIAIGRQIVRPQANRKPVSAKRESSFDMKIQVQIRWIPVRVDHAGNASGIVRL